MDPVAARAVFDSLLAAYGPQHWWPAQTPFEVMVGAVLTQNTAWVNVERGLERLQSRLGGPAALGAEQILALPEADLAECLRSVGYFNVKARRLRSFCAEYLDAGGLDGLTRLDTLALRRRLLAIHGVGPETADDMVLYAFDRPVFVVDAYTRRLGGRLGLLGGSSRRRSTSSIPGVVGGSSKPGATPAPSACPPSLVARRRFWPGMASIPGAQGAASGTTSSIPGVVDGEAGYETIRHVFELALGPDVPLFNEYHALIVRHAKDVCRTKPRCEGCCLRGLCVFPAAG
jgi:endonuclease-3 related protein